MQLETKSAALALTEPHTLEDAKRIPASQVRELCGGVSDMTLWRWLDSDTLNFPKPIRITGRRYWRKSDLLAWLDAQGVVE